MDQSEADAQATLDLIQREVAVLVRRALRGTVLHTGAGVQALDLPTFALLARVADQGPQRSSELARAFSLDKSTVSRQVAALQRAGLVERVDDPDDRRAFLVSITAEGRRSLEQVRRERRRAYRRLLAQWSEDDRRELARLLSQLNLDLGRQAGSARSAADRPAAGGGRTGSSEQR